MSKCKLSYCDKKAKKGRFCEESHDYLSNKEDKKEKTKEEVKEDEKA